MNNYSEKEYEIFSRLFILKDFSETNIKILSKLNISIVGVGGIGCPLSQYLVSSGIKKLISIDSVEIIFRQFFVFDMKKESKCC